MKKTREKKAHTRTHAKKRNKKKGGLIVSLDLHSLKKKKVEQFEMFGLWAAKQARNCANELTQEFLRVVGERSKPEAEWERKFLNVWGERNKRGDFELSEASNDLRFFERASEQENFWGIWTNAKRARILFLYLWDPLLPILLCCSCKNLGMFPKFP